MMELQKRHEDSLNKLAAEMKAQDRCWQKQRRDLEQHYSALLSEVQARAQNMQSNLREVNMELSHLRSKYADKESQIGSIQKDLAESQHGREKEKLRVMEAEKEIQNLTRTYQKDTELSHLEYVCKNKSDAMMELQKSHEDSLNKLAAEMKAQDRCWQKQRRDLEQHYSALLSEVQARAQNMQSDLREVNMELSHLRSQYADKESQIGSIQKDLAESQHGWEKEKLRVMEAKKEIQFLTRTYQKDTENMQSDLREVNMELSHLRSQYADKESQIGSIQKDLAESQHGWEKEKLRVMEAKKEIQFLTRTYQKDTENMQSDLREVNMELSHLRSQYADKESQIGSIQKDLAESQHGWEKEKLRVMEAKKEIQFLTRTYQKDTEENQTFLHGLYQRLLARGVLIKQPESMLDQFSWSELCLVLQENVDVLISDLNQANEKVSHLEYVCKNKSEAMMELQKRHEDSLNKLAAEMKAQERCWQKQRRDLEQHYSALLSEVQARAQSPDSRLLDTSSQERFSTTVLNNESRLPSQLTSQTSEDEQLMYSSSSEFSELLALCENSESEDELDTFISDMISNISQQSDSQGTKTREEAETGTKVKSPDSKSSLLDTSSQERFNSESEDKLDTFISDMISNILQQSAAAVQEQSNVDMSEGDIMEQNILPIEEQESPDSRLLDTSSQERFSTTVLNNESRLPSQLTSQTSEDEQLMYSSSSEFSELLALCENSESEDELDTFISDMISNISQQSDSQGTKTREEAETGTKVKSPDSKSSLLDTSSQERFNSESEDKLDTFISDMISNILQQSAAAVQEQSNVDMSEGDIMEQNILPIEEQEEIPSLNKKRKPWYVRLFCCCGGARKNRK